MRRLANVGLDGVPLHHVGLGEHPAYGKRRIAREVRAWPEVSTTLVTIGDNSQQTPNLASIFVRLLPPDKRKASQDQLQARVREKVIEFGMPGFLAGFFTRRIPKLARWQH